ncbi:MAG: hypothetical protein ABIP68_02565 [Ferruginibacter sp.]
MKNKFTLLSVALIFFMASCTTSYKNSQTVDDVYYSPLKNVTKVQQDSEEDLSEVRQIRMSTRDPRWRTLDNQYDYDYNNNPYRYSYGYGYYYNPYYYAYPVYYYPGLSYIKSTNSTPRMTNLGAYTTPTTTATPVKNPKTGSMTNGRGQQPYNNSNSGSTRRVIRSSSDNNSSSNDTRTYSPSSSGSSNQGSRGSSAPVSRPSRP